MQMVPPVCNRNEMKIWRSLNSSEHGTSLSRRRFTEDKRPENLTEIFGTMSPCTRAPKFSRNCDLPPHPAGDCRRILSPQRGLYITSDGVEPDVGGRNPSSVTKKISTPCKRVTETGRYCLAMLSVTRVTGSICFIIPTRGCACCAGAPHASPHR